MSAVGRSLRILLVLALVATTVVVRPDSAEAANVSFTDVFDGSTTLSNYTVDRRLPLSFTQGVVKDGRDVAEMVVDSTGPVAPDFARFQGLKHTTDGSGGSSGYYDNGVGTCLTVEFRLDDDFLTEEQFVSFWTVTSDVADVLDYPIVGFYSDGTDQEFWVWDDATHWETYPLPSGFDSSAWHNLRFEMHPDAWVWHVDGEILWIDPAGGAFGQDTVEHIILQMQNFGSEYSAYYDSYSGGDCTPTNLETTSVEMVRPGELGDWAPVETNTAHVGFVTGYGADSGDGSLQLDTGDGVGPGQGGKAWGYTTDVEGVKLNEFVDFSYATFVDSASTSAGHIAPAINMHVDLDGDNLRDTTLVFEPVYVQGGQGAVVQDVWQTWDVLSGDGWWYTANFGTLTNQFNQFESIDYYIAAYPDAKVVNWGLSPALAFVTGQSSGGPPWNTFYGAVDSLTVSTLDAFEVTYDLEPPLISATDVEVDEPAIGQESVEIPVSIPDRNGAVIDPSKGVPVSVDWTLTAGTATPGDDYLVGSGTVIIPAGATQTTVDVTILGDDLDEADETFTLELTASTEVNGVIADGSALVTIKDTDAPVLTYCRACNVTHDTIDLYWAVEGFGSTGFRVYLDGQPMADLPADADFYRFGGLTPETTYEVGVTVLSSAGESPLLDHEVTTPHVWTDTADSIFIRSIAWLTGKRITVGCNPQTNNDRYCPDSFYTRGQASAMVKRALELPDSANDYFVDDDTSIFEPAFNALAEAGILSGCNPPVNDRICPDDEITRGQLAALIDRALGLPDGAVDYFSDDNGHIFEGAINRLAEARITLAVGEFRPDDLITRGEAAAFIYRAFHCTGLQ